MTLEQILDALSERLRPEHTIFATPYRPTVWRNLTPDIRYALAHGDHWLGGALWRGRRPQDGDMREIETLFTQDDRIAPALELYVSATLGNGWDWNERTDEGQELTPLEQGETEALSVWHYDAGLDTALSRLLYLATAMRSSYLRLYVPDDYDTEPIRTLEDAFDVMHAQVLDSRQAGKILDDHGRVAAMYYRYSVRENNQDVPHIELHTPETIHYYRAESRLEPLKNDDGSLKIIPNPLYDPRRKRKPRYLIQELDIGAALLTEGIADLQCRLNVSRVNEARNDDLHGFPALYTLDTENPVDDDGRETKWQLEPDVVMQIKSDPKELDADGNTLERYQGKVGRLEAVDPDYILKTISSYHESIADSSPRMWG